jgi:hypothetical protein
LKAILADLREKTIDGVLGDRAETLTYLQTHHPLKAASTTAAAQTDAPP